jgi:hypothetical protein
MSQELIWYEGKWKLVEIIPESKVFWPGGVCCRQGSWVYSCEQTSLGFLFEWPNLGFASLFWKTHLYCACCSGTLCETLVYNWLWEPRVWGECQREFHPSLEPVAYLHVWPIWKKQKTFQWREIQIPILGEEIRERERERERGIHLRCFAFFSFSCQTIIELWTVCLVFHCKRSAAVQMASDNARHRLPACN